ncbi:hypothetical protein EV643_126103 [Kribbella sp. VKM Ac-2527]|uniref:Uncharacterized protein n=1 Tax=Kribbella caucasensis TaxID=2512215 RepID=A0A4R6JFK7_9ACTN|nr:hypothetical protein EV643_126103 [Kribbella sp. VKM Ac-2527]
MLQRILDSEPDLSPSQIAHIQQQLYQDRNTLARLRQELVLCLSDITIVGVEKTQGIQFFSINGQGSGYAPDNSVPLIAQRTLILRVYVDCKRVQQQGPQHLPIHISGSVIVDRIRTNGSVTRVATLKPINGPIAARSSASIDRGDPNHTLNFRVAASDCQGLLRFTVTVFEQGPVVIDDVLGAIYAPRPSERDTWLPGSATTTAAAPAAFSLKVHGRFEPVPTFRVQAVLVHYTGGGQNLPAPTGFDFADTLEYVLKTFPIGRLEFEDCIEIDFDKNLSTCGGGCGPGFEGPGGLMVILKDLDDSSDRPAIRVALIPSDARMCVGGCGNKNIAAAQDGRGATLAQEMGHALDRKHAPYAPGWEQEEPPFPQYGDYPLGSIGEYGFDVVTSEVYDPNTSHDFMSYGSDRWVSPHTYVGLRNEIVERFSDASFAGLADGRFSPSGDPSQETLFLSFRVNRDGSVEVHPSFHLPARAQPPDHTSTSDVSCELLDGKGQVLGFHRCRARGSHVDPDGPHIDFHEAIPWVDEATAIRFLRNKEVLHLHDIEALAPTVKLPASGLRSSEQRLTLKWEGHHPERAVTYLVRYSRDAGRTWRVVAVNSSKSECVLRQRQLPGGEQCLLQVVASSGIRTHVAQTKPFSVPSEPRSATILSPKSTSETTSTGQALLRGGAFSSDYGLGAPEDVVWSSNVDGVLGRGFELIADGLSEGAHTITLTAPDGQGGVATASAVLRVVLPD